MKSIKPIVPGNFQKIKKNLVSGDIWSHFYGILGTISLIFTIVYSLIAIKNNDSVEYKSVVLSLSIIVSVVVITFVIVVAYYQRRFKELNDLPASLFETKLKNDQLSLTIKAQSECSHTINHYFRNIENQLDEFSTKVATNVVVTEEECNRLLSRCKDFLLNTTTSLQSFFTIASGYKSSATIKIVLSDKNTNVYYVKTLYRDPLSLKKRRYVENGYSSQNGVYSASENTAFDVILSSNHINNYYASDNLNGEYEQHNYRNSNKFWNKHYNATIVVPISIVLGKNCRNVIGFIAIDNLTSQNGNLNDAGKIEFLFSIGDLFYTFIQKYLNLITFANSKYKTDDFHKQIIAWG